MPMHILLINMNFSLSCASLDSFFYTLSLSLSRSPVISISFSFWFCWKTESKPKPMHYIGCNLTSVLFWLDFYSHFHFSVFFFIHFSHRCAFHFYDIILIFGRLMKHIYKFCFRIVLPRLCWSFRFYYKDENKWENWHWNSTTSMKSEKK